MATGNLHLMPEPLPRDQYLQIVRAGLASRQSAFARQAILNWLAIYPGDLQAGLYYARVLVGEGRLYQSLPVIHGLCKADPEFIEAVELLLQVVEQLQAESASDSIPVDLPSGEIEGRRRVRPKLSELVHSSRAHRFALMGESQGNTLLASWGGPLWFARHAIEMGDLHLAGTLIQDILSQDLLYPLEAVTHLHYLDIDQETPLATKYRIARSYYERWPDCLVFMLRLAEWSQEHNEKDYSVALVHQAAARDLGGQVARRTWGEAHPFRSLWPVRLELKLDLAIPAIVMAMLGWNRLPPGMSVTDQPLSELAEEAEENAIQPPSDLEAETKPISIPAAETLSEEIGAVNQHESGEPILPTCETVEMAKVASFRRERKSHSLSRELQSVEDELERVATRLSLAGIARQDGRFPIYVIFSTRSRLESVYGPVISSLLESEMEQLAEAVRSRPGWGAKVFFADDPSDTLSIGSKPAKPDDPWELKLHLADLDDALSKHGERVGAVLIVGGEEIVPFHRLPNPVDDQDEDVPSDNPYSTRDENYFIPEWPVGRLPGGVGSDARLLLEALRRYRMIHTVHKRKLSWDRRLANWISDLVSRLLHRRTRNFGYTAAVWRRSAEAVFKSVAGAGKLHVSPPAGYWRQRPDGSNGGQSPTTGVPQISGRLGYFNLHGLVDSPEWYGHGDLLRSANQLDYPVALRPEDIQNSSAQLEIPKVIFSEACYGMHVQDRSLDEAIALKFLDAGSLAVAGSTCMAYGSIDLPLVAADLLGQTFWRFLKEGLPAGEALRQAKIYLASEMNHRQGYLDGEDQKTLISFVLYGDPLAEPLRKDRVPKSIRYRAKPMNKVLTVCDRGDSPGEAGPVPVEVMDSVRQAVAKYLPGMSDARVAWAYERDLCQSVQHDCPTGQLQSIEGRISDKQTGGKVGPNGSACNEKGPSLTKAYRRLVTLSKQVSRSGELHPEIARLTLDEQGKVVKLVVSR